MKKGTVLSVALSCILFAGSANAGKIGFINDPELAQKSTALQGLKMQQEKMLAMLKIDLEKEAKAIVEKKQKLEEESASLSKTEVGKQLDAIANAEKDLQTRAQEASAELQKNFIDAARSFKEKAINPVIKELVEENGFDAVLNEANTFYVAEDLNVTEEAIKRVNKKMPKIEMKKVTLKKATSK